jgi:hypothetical protein
VHITSDNVAKIDLNQVLSDPYSSNPIFSGVESLNLKQKDDQMDWNRLSHFVLDSQTKIPLIFTKKVKKEESKQRFFTQSPFKGRRSP